MDLIWIGFPIGFPVGLDCSFEFECLWVELDWITDLTRLPSTQLKTCRSFTLGFYIYI